MTVVVGTAGHIDHGKTSLLRALTGIDADRLPEERRRGMTIDVGYAHLALDDGSEIDFVDVPGHDRLVGNMLVGAGEIDAALLVVAADDGPRAQTLEHLELLDALAIDEGLAVVTKWDLLPADDPRRDRVVDVVRRLLAETSLSGVPVIAASATSGEGLDDVRRALVAVRDRVRARRRPGPLRLAVDRVFSVRGRGSVVTGTLRGGRIATGQALRGEPGGIAMRARELQVHGHPVASKADGGRVAVNVSGVDAGVLRRGLVLTSGPGVVTTDRLLVALTPPAAFPPDLSGGAERRRWPLAHDERLRLHVGTEQVTARVRRGIRDWAALGSSAEVFRLVLERPIAVAVEDAIVLRRPSPGETAAGGRVLDAAPPSGVSRRRSTPDRLRALAAAETPAEMLAAQVALHGILSDARAAAVGAASGAAVGDAQALPPIADARHLGRWFVAEDVAAALEEAAVGLVAARHAAEPLAAGLPLAELRPRLARSLRRSVTLPADDAAAVASAVVEAAVAAGRLARDGDLVRDPRRAAGLPAPVLEAMARLEAALDVPAPPPFADAVHAAGCPPEGVRALEAAGRIVRIDPSLAWSGATYRRLAALAASMARGGPLTPAAFRDATGTSRKYSLAVLEDLDRRGILRRTPDGHVPGQRAPG